MAAATAGLPKTAACSPKTMTFPGADTMNAGAIGDETFLSMFRMPGLSLGGLCLKEFSFLASSFPTSAKPQSLWQNFPHVMPRRFCLSRGDHLRGGLHAT